MSPVPERPNVCPVCGKPTSARHAPFCSKRCADIDLGRWLKGAYAIPGGADAETERADQSGADQGEASEE